MKTNKTGVIGYLVPEFPGQTHIFFWREIVSLKKLGFSIKLVSTRMPPTKIISHVWSKEAIDKTDYLYPISAKDIILSVKCFPLGIFYNVLTSNCAKGERLAVFKDLIICTPFAYRLTKIINREALSHIHVHSCARSAFIALIAARKTGIPYSLTLHGDLSDYRPGLRLKWCGAAFAAIITNQLYDEVRNQLSGYLPEQILIQPMGVNSATFCRCQPYQSATKRDRINLFSCGRLNFWKGHQDLLDATKLLVQEGYDVFVEIAGEDEKGGHGFHVKLEEQIQDLGLGDRVNLLGAIDEEKVREKLENAHIFVLASLGEALGVAYMEAMSMELPTIGTHTGGVGELIENNVNGVLVAPSDPEMLADAIEKIVNNPSHAINLGREGRKTVVERFDSVKGAAKMANAIRQSIATGPR